MGKLTNKRKAFIEEYLRCWNATRAAERAGYRHPNVKGSQLVKVSAVADAISARLQAKAMQADEVLARLADMARGDISEFVDAHGIIDFQAVQDNGCLVRKIAHTAGKNSSIEMYDAQAALEKIGRALQLFTGKYELSGPGGGPIAIENVGGLTEEERIRALLAFTDAFGTEGDASRAEDMAAAECPAVEGVS